MKQFLIFICGFVAGILFILFISLIFSFSYSREEVQVQHIDVKGKKGEVTLYVGMPKDSVLMLVGKPDNVNLYSSGGTTSEGWNYNLKNNIVLV